jgi:predicted ATPase
MLSIRLQAAEDARARHASQFDQLDRQRPTDTVALMRARIERFEKSIANRAETSRKLREQIAALRARITVEGGAGLDEQIAAAERGQAGLTRERDAAALEAETLRLLLHTLAEAERDTRERYLEPVRRRITPYLAGLFPGATIKCDDALRITSVTRDDITPPDFDRLSDGTQEQIAVLARLAFAELLLDQGKPAMVILDDALAYSDDERMQRMFDILTTAASRMQILVLTCREDLYARAGGHPLKLEAL